MVANATMSRAIDDIRQEHDEQLEKTQAEYGKKYQKKLADMQKKVEKGQKVLDEKRKECSTQKALADQAKTQLARTEREVDNYLSVRQIINWFSARQSQGRAAHGRSRGGLATRDGIVEHGRFEGAKRRDEVQTGRNGRDIEHGQGEV